MESKLTWALRVVGIVLLGAALLSFSSNEETAPSSIVQDEAPSSLEVGEQAMMETPVTVTPAPTFRVNAKDKISAWEFTGRYAGNETLTINAQTDIARLQSMLGAGKFPDYDLYTGIGNNYTYLGDGEKAFAAYKKAISLNPERGIIYMNIGNLMEQLGALYSAKDAYAKAVAVEPGIVQFKNAEADFLAQHPELSKAN